MSVCVHACEYVCLCVCVCFQCESIICMQKLQENPLYLILTFHIYYRLGFLGPNSGWQVWWNTPLPTELSNKSLI